ncbi:MAG: c-type cytochrome [Chroococcidiopsidaceae cyanobacterium CP_BM_RX_35]|nr:c-type cytochrome [Chroococcidiopsidaceae cyanobacterium CP_BM_RX_35]
MRSLLSKLFIAKYFRLIVVFFLAIAGAIVLSNSLSHAQLPQQTPLAGGETTVFNRTSHGLQQPAANLTTTELTLHQDGDRAFEAVFVSAPAPVNAGLGPTFNNTSCTACHINDGRGLPVKGNLLVRVSLPMAHPVAASQPIAAGGSNKQQESIFESQPEASVTLGNAPPVPGIGTQIQDQALYGHQPKATVEISWQETSGTYGDGTAYRLRSPRLKITLPDSKPLPSEVLTSPRVPPPITGRGLLEAIPESTLLALADPQDKNQDGISGRPNYVWDVQKKAKVLGRFGLKANNPHLFQQNATAYVNDMGVTNPLFPKKDGASDIDTATLQSATFYTQTVGVPARTLLNDLLVQRGEKLFAQANCAACHIAELRTGDHPVKPVANQIIHPYTDLLLHDMGPGLADGRPDFEASGTEWRTPPLWGLGLTKTVLSSAGYLHDGRARTLEEAILWHGGEAESAKQAFRALAKSDHEALLRFLTSL